MFGGSAFSSYLCHVKHYSHFLLSKFARFTEKHVVISKTPTTISLSTLKASFLTRGEQSLRPVGRKNKVPPTNTTDGQDFGEWYARLVEENRKRNEERIDEMEYQKWLMRHSRE